MVLQFRVFSIATLVGWSAFCSFNFPNIGNCWNISCFKMIGDVYIFVFNSPSAKPIFRDYIFLKLCTSIWHFLFCSHLEVDNQFCFTSFYLLFFLCNFLIVSLDNVIHILHWLQLMYLAKNEIGLGTKLRSHSQVYWSFWVLITLAALYNPWNFTLTQC